MHPHWLALDLLVEDGPGSENLSQLQFSMWLVALPAQLYHYVPLPILTRWLTPLLVFRDGFCWRFCSLWPPHILLFSRRGICCQYLQVWISFLDIFVLLTLVFLNYLCYFVSPSLVCLNYIEIISPSSACLNYSGIIIILFSCVLARLKISMLVIFVFRPGSKFPCLFGRTLFYRGYRAFSFLLDPVPFLFLFCFVYSNSLALEASCECLGFGRLFSFGLSNAYWCGPGRSHVEG